MIIYKDLFTEDELFTDVYKITLIEDVLYKVEGKNTSETTDISDALIGGNKSAEDPVDEGAEASTQSGVNIVLANKLQQISRYNTKKDYQTYLKGYLKKLEAKLVEVGKPERVDIVKNKLAKALKEEVFTGYKEKEFDVYIGSSDKAFDGMHCLLAFRPEDDVPYMLFIKDGLIEEKC